jgi:AraC-like DNA-binding protein
VAEALIENSRSLPLVSDSVTLALVVRGRSARYELEAGEPALLHPQAAQQILGSVWFGLRRCVGPGPPLGAVLAFTQGPPPDPARHRRLAGGPVRFGALVNAIELPTDDLLRPLRTGDADAHGRRRAEAERRPATGSAFVGHVRQVIGDELARGTLSEAAVAARLGLHPRTLARRLGQRGTSFRRLADDERLGQARRLLHTGSTVEHVAHRLGYSDGTAFARAFKRWTGSTPAAYRAAAR